MKKELILLSLCCLPAIGCTGTATGTKQQPFSSTEPARDSIFSVTEWEKEEETSAVTSVVDTLYSTVFRNRYRSADFRSAESYTQKVTGLPERIPYSTILSQWNREGTDYSLLFSPKYLFTVNTPNGQAVDFIPLEIEEEGRRRTVTLLANYDLHVYDYKKEGAGVTESYSLYRLNENGHFDKQCEHPVPEPRKEYTEKELLLLELKRNSSIHPVRSHYPIDNLGIGLATPTQTSFDLYLTGREQTYTERIHNYRYQPYMNPFYNLDNDDIYFIVNSLSDDLYEICLNEHNTARVSPSEFRYDSWEEFLCNRVFCIRSTTGIAYRDQERTEEFSFDTDINFEVAALHGEWILVGEQLEPEPMEFTISDDQHWIQWRDGSTLLIDIYLFY